MPAKINTLRYVVTLFLYYNMKRKMLPVLKVLATLRFSIVILIEVCWHRYDHQHFQQWHLIHINYFSFGIEWFFSIFSPIFEVECLNKIKGSRHALAYFHPPLPLSGILHLIMKVLVGSIHLSGKSKILAPLLVFFNMELLVLPTFSSMSSQK